MKIAEVVDRESLKVYLDELSENTQLRVANFITSRRILRIIPWLLDEKVAVFRNPADELEDTRGRIFLSAACVIYSELEFNLETSALAMTGRFTAEEVEEENSNLRSLLFDEVRVDLTAAQNGLDQLAPLCEGIDLRSLLEAKWSAIKKQLLADTAGDWSFWIKWYDRNVEGKSIHPDLLNPILFKLTSENVLGEPALVNSLFDGVLAVYKAEDAAAVSDLQTDVSKAFYFDFIEVNRQMRAVSFPSDQSAFADDAARDEFLTAAKDLRIYLEDWVDLARAHLQGRNAPVTTVVSIEHILDQLKDLEAGKDVSLRNLVRLGSNAKRLARGEEAKADLGDDLHGILNDGLDDYSSLMRLHLGDVLAALDALKSLELGDLDSAVLMASMKKGYARLRSLDTDEILQPDPQTVAVFNDMMDDLESEQSEINEASTQVARDVRGKRFAEKFGGVSATFGRYAEKATQGSNAGGSRIDELVKWFKRVENLQKIKDWWDALGGPPP